MSTLPRRTSRRRARAGVVLRLVAAAVIVAAVAVTASLLLGRSSGPAVSRRTCAYTGTISAFGSFERLAGRQIDCALVFNDASPGWPGWEQPWFLTHRDPNLNWGKWQRADPEHRQLVITQNLFPAQLNNSDWLHAGASGAFTGHARALARNLVAAGQGKAVVRLGHEPNGTWYPDSLGQTDADFQLWRQFWRKTVLAMRSVPGAHFQFDFCVNAGVRPIPLQKYYPGDDVVDIIGADTYDAGFPLPAGQKRWRTLYDRPGGLRDIRSFAAAHDKPLSIPEWGIGPTGDQYQSAGDDPAYVNGIASVLRDSSVAYESYFYNQQWAKQLNGSPKSLAAVRRLLAEGD